MCLYCVVTFTSLLLLLCDRIRSSPLVKFSVGSESAWRLQMLDVPTGGTCATWRWSRHAGTRFNQSLCRSPTRWTRRTVWTQWGHDSVFTDPTILTDGRQIWKMALLKSRIVLRGGIAGSHSWNNTQTFRDCWLITELFKTDVLNRQSNLASLPKTWIQLSNLAFI